MPGGAAVGHAELWFGNTCVMLSDEFPDMGIVGPKTLGGVSGLMSLYVSNADAVFERAIAAGAKVKRPLTDEFYGDRTGQLEDPVWPRVVDPNADRGRQPEEDAKAAQRYGCDTRIRAQGEAKGKAEAKDQGVTMMHHEVTT